MTKERGLIHLALTILLLVWELIKCVRKNHKRVQTKVITM